ncbi:hypothetical protein CC85DRAFT_125935 [Cutaneotrichosporon oleaginosum]|uniref:Uncharacterized protein n=1 Tax=Cutaneotrichosporon oleaginosum TaxID=879819 RepID=A0A0J1B0U1_9TREE|nr:uncharacterized protein CC85DRAFT_125935 [Cutaneotrichosporon oleaginosum]KLT41229.1 hypothetical protein CC85DRAFT_125935 [Cutaneotrichosporon oleaginosum]TXT05492.1 hypothetical protein COLE_06812 [Cutaneotrichosporon oleaginosum]
MPSAVNEKQRHNGHPHHNGHHHNGHASHERPSLALVPASGSVSPHHRSNASALLSLSQDVTALVSLSIETAASLVNDYARSALATIGLGERPPTRGPGLAVVVVGAAELSGQSLTLRLAKSGYTVFPFVPIAAAPSAGTAPVSAPLSALLLAWSGVQKRLRARDPGHTGAVVPVVIDDSGDAYLSAQTYPHSAFPPSPPKRGGRFAHAGDTVRHYCRENGLTLVAIVCAAPTTSLPSKDDLPSPLPLSPARRPHPLIPGVTDAGLAHADEDALMALYRTQVIEPISVIRALGDMLAAPRGVNRVRGRVLFVESTSIIDESEPGDVFSGQSSPMRMIAAARAETARLLRAELGSAGIDVCEIAVGPMAPRLPLPLRSSSGDSDTDRALAAAADLPTQPASDDAISLRLRVLARIFAVDDALVYSCVRRAIEDRYPRARHHAGLTPLITSIVNATPGAGVVRFLGRWVLGQLFSPRRRA